jgi:hypothetical protein
MLRHSPPTLRAPLISAALAALAMLVPAAAAQAAATVVRFGPITTPITDFIPSDDCRPSLSASVTGTDVLVGQIVQTPPPSSGSIFEGQDTTTLTVRYSDGSYALGTSSFRFVGPEMFLGPPSDPTRVSIVTFPSRDSLTIYDASGQVIGSETFRAIEHYIIDDLPPFGPSDNDVVRVSFEHGRLTCNV